MLVNRSQEEIGTETRLPIPIVEAIPTSLLLRSTTSHRSAARLTCAAAPDPCDLLRHRRQQPGRADSEATLRKRHLKPNLSRMSRGNTSFVHGRYLAGDKVEVLSSEEGFSDAWATATVVSKSAAGYLVEYSKFVDGDGKPLREKVRIFSRRRRATSTRPCHARHHHACEYVHRRPATGASEGRSASSASTATHAPNFDRCARARHRSPS